MYFKLAVALHISSCRKISGFATKRFGLLGSVASRARGTNSAKNQCQYLVILGKENSTQFVRIKKHRGMSELLKARTGGNIVNNSIANTDTASMDTNDG